jgi:hypothetical protein
MQGIAASLLDLEWRPRPASRGAADWRGNKFRVHNGSRENAIVILMWAKILHEADSIQS